MFNFYLLIFNCVLPQLVPTVMPKYTLMVVPSFLTKGLMLSL